MTPNHLRIRNPYSYIPLVDHNYLILFSQCYKLPTSFYKLPHHKDTQTIIARRSWAQHVQTNSHPKPKINPNPDGICRYMVLMFCWWFRKNKMENGSIDPPTTSNTFISISKFLGYPKTYNKRVYMGVQMEKSSFKSFSCRQILNKTRLSFFDCTTIYYRERDILEFFPFCLSAAVAAAGWETISSAWWRQETLMYATLGWKEGKWFCQFMNRSNFHMFSFSLFVFSFHSLRAPFVIVLITRR